MEVQRQSRGSEPWWSELREIHERHFDSQEWNTHLRKLRAGFPELDNEQITPGGSLPPPLFNGDIEALLPQRWALVVSLNPAPDSDKEEWYRKGNFEVDSYWHHWRTFNRRFFYTRFFRPLVMVASVALDEETEFGDAERRFACENLCFVELCPYASRGFGQRHTRVLDQLKDDPGFVAARSFRDRLIDLGQPRVILANGNPVVEDFSETGEDIDWEWVDYQSNDNCKPLRWRPGKYRTSTGKEVPIAGFPFLNKARSANSHKEYRQLGRKIKEYVEEGEIER